MLIDKTHDAILLVIEAVRNECKRSTKPELADIMQRCEERITTATQSEKYALQIVFTFAQNEFNTRD